MTDEAKGALDADTPTAEDGAAVDQQGVRVDAETIDDPKSGGTPVHPSPTADSAQTGPDAEDAGAGADDQDTDGDD
jgi:hypothetical protein